MNRTVRLVVRIDEAVRTVGTRGPEMRKRHLEELRVIDMIWEMRETVEGHTMAEKGIGDESASFHFQVYLCQSIHSPDDLALMLAAVTCKRAQTFLKCPPLFERQLGSCESTMAPPDRDEVERFCTREHIEASKK